jgi:hypothetical protein
MNTRFFSWPPCPFQRSPAIYIYIYDELLGYHFVEHMAAMVSSSRQSQLKHEKGMQWDANV